MDTPAERLKFARKQRGWNQIKLAEEAGVATGTVGNIESGKRGIKASALALARALNVSPYWLEDGNGPMEITGSLARVTAGLDSEIKFTPSGNTIDAPSRWVDEPQPERAALGMTTALPTLAQALEALASAFAHTPESTRNTVATLTASAVRDPATLPDCLRAIEALAAYSTATVETAAISKVGA